MPQGSKVASDEMRHCHLRALARSCIQPPMRQAVKRRCHSLRDEAAAGVLDVFDAISIDKRRREEKGPDDAKIEPDDDPDDQRARDHLGQVCVSITHACLRAVRCERTFVIVSSVLAKRAPSRSYSSPAFTPSLARRAPEYAPLSRARCVFRSSSALCEKRWR